MSRSLYPVVWSDGLLISAQHFQQQDLFHASQLNARILTLSQNAWGIRDLELDLDYTHTDEGEVVLVRGDVIFPSGLLATWGEDYSSSSIIRQTLPNRTSESSLKKEERVSIYLSISKLREGVSNIKAPQVSQDRQGSHRFVTYQRTVPEHCFAQTEAVEVTFGRPNLQISFDRQDPVDMEYLKIGEIYRTPIDAKWILDDAFCPPCIHFHFSRNLTERLRFILRQFQEHAQFLRTTLDLPRQLVRQQSATRSVDTAFVFYQYQCFRQIVSIIRSVLLQKNISPYAAYHALSIAADMCNDLGSSQNSIYEPTDYTHNSIATCFYHIYDHLRFQMPTSHSKCFSIAMSPDSNGYYHAQIPDNMTSQIASCFIKLGSTQPIDLNTITRWQSLTKIASPSSISGLFRASVQGIGLTKTLTVPDGLTAGSHDQFFELNCKSEGWLEVASESELVVAPPEGLGKIFDKIDLILKLKARDNHHD